MHSSDAKNDNSGIHKGHRERLRTQFLEHGLDSLSDINVLELVLFYAIPRQDTNPIAHRLLDTFGSLSGVLDASTEDLIHKGGLSRNAAALLKLIPAAARRHSLSKAQPGRILDTVEACAARVVPYFLYETEECACLLCLDGKCKELGLFRLSEGSANETGLSIRAAVEIALGKRAVSVVLAHNHISGSPLPSQADLTATEDLAHALALVGVTLADHIIVAGEEYISLLESGVIVPPQNS